MHFASCRGNSGKGLFSLYVDELGVEVLGAEVGAAAGAEAGVDVELSVAVAGALVSALASDAGGSDPVSDSLLLAA